MRTIVLCDVDHVISNAFWRDDLAAERNWDAYHAAAAHDNPVPDVVHMLRALQASHEIIGLTARPEKWRKATTEWLWRNDVPCNELLMRPNRDFRPAAQLKLALASERLGVVRDEVALVLDDRADVCEAFAGAGVTALQVYARRVE